MYDDEMQQVIEIKFLFFKSDSTEMFAMTGSVDGCRVLPETQVVGTRLRVDTTRVVSVGGLLLPM